MSPSNNSTPPHSGNNNALGVCIFLLLAIALIYEQTLEHPLLDYDDNGFVSANLHVTAGLTGAGIRWAFTEGPYGEWYPLATLSHMLDCQVFGLNAWGHHLTNLLLHAAGSIALFLVFWRMTDELWPSALVAALFAVHPQHVESVAWVSERRDVLSGLFFMLTLAGYLGYVRHGRSLGRYLLVAAVFALGLMSKPMLVTLPPLLLLLDFWPLARIGSAGDTPGWAQSVDRPGLLRLLLEKLPLFALAAGDCLMTLQTHFAASAPRPWSERIGNAAVACVSYVVQFFYPVDLAAIYPIPAGGPPTWKVAAALAILMVASAAAVIWRRRCPYMFVGWFWYLGMLSPVLGLVPIADHGMADRYTYLPGIGLYIALAWGAVRIAASQPAWRFAIGACAWLAVAALVTCATRQTSFWRDDETLWLHAVESTTDNAIAETGLGYALARQGRFDDAVALYRQALSVKPDLFQAHLHLGSALSRQGQFDEAMQHLRRALEIDPHSVSAYLALGRLLVFQRKFDDARVALEQALAIDPNNAGAHNDLGSALFLQGKIEDSIPQYEAALALDPNFVLAHNNLADALAARGRIDEAISHYRRALQLEPQNAEAQQKLAVLLPDGAKRPRPDSPNR